MKKDLLLHCRRMLIETERNETSVTALEYGLITALIAAVVVTAVSTLDSNLNPTFTNIARHFRIAGF